MVQLSFCKRACTALVLSVSFYGFGQNHIKPKQLRFQDPNYSKKAYVKSLLIPMGCHHLVRSLEDDILQSSSQLCLEKAGDRIILSTLKLAEDNTTDDILNLENIKYPIVQFPLNMQSSGGRVAGRFLSLPGARLGAGVEQSFVFFLHQADTSLQQIHFEKGVVFDEAEHADAIDVSYEKSFYESIIPKSTIDDFLASIYVYMLTQLESTSEQYNALSKNILVLSKKNDAELKTFKTSDAHKEHIHFLEGKNFKEVHSLYDFSVQNNLYREYISRALTLNTSKHLTLVPVWVINMEDNKNLSNYEVLNKNFEMNHPEDLWYMVLAPKL
ncbi:MAG TPA: hypothetical protein PKC21_08350 [Oligoflexia bacterium]|mgnify:CR=1 FL=1|nr:hypothetical protein [Oligoflexia bacterium]HMR25350.1 hypothetical protein [Oligoflexia bacterium]